MDRVDIINSTLGKAMGGGTGGYTSGTKEMISVLRNKSRPYLFSNSVSPNVVGASLAAFDLLNESGELLTKLHDNMTRFRAGLEGLGFNLGGHPDHPIIPVMLGDARLASEFADAMLEQGIYVIGFSYPVVPHGQARIRVQISAAHSEQEIERAIEAFGKVKQQLID